MPHIINLVRVSISILSGLFCGHTATRCDIPTPKPSPLIASQPEDAAEPSTCDELFPASASTLATLRTTASLAAQIDQAAHEMRQLDRLELPERAVVAWRLHERLCEIGEQLDAEKSSPLLAPNLPPAIDDTPPHGSTRHSESADHRALVRSLLAAILIAPEKSAFMSKASRRRAQERGVEKAKQRLVIGDLALIKKTDRAWLFLLTDPFNDLEQHTVRIELGNLSQRIALGSRVAVLGKTVPHDGTTSDTPIMATEVYAIKPSNHD